MNDKRFLPINLNIEVTDHCNLRCPMCFHYYDPLIHGVKYPKKMMEVETVKGIIHQLEESGLKLRCISPFWSGEPLVHPRFDEILKFIFSANQENDVFNDFIINTNAVSLSSEISDIFFDYAAYLHKYSPGKNISLALSLDFVTPTTFKNVKGNKEEFAHKVIANIEYLIKRRAELQLTSPTLLFQFVVQNSNKHEADEFIRFWSRKLDAYHAKYDVLDSPKFFSDRDAICVTRRLDGTEMSLEDCRRLHRCILKDLGFYASDYANSGDVSNADILTFRRPCYQIWNALLITSQGIATPCCKDLHLDLLFGDIKENTLFELIRAPRLHQMRLWHVRGELENLPFCASCFDPPGGCASDEEVIKYLEETGEKEELVRYKEKLKEEARANSSAKKLPLEKAAPALQESDYQLRVYDFYSHKDNPASVIHARKIGELEFESGLGVDLEVSYRLADASQWVLLEYTPKKKDWSGYSSVNIRLKGDGKGGRLQFIIQEQDGDNWYYFIEDAFDTTGWKEYSLALDKFTMPEWATKGDGQRTFDRIASYKLLFERHESAVGQEKTVHIGNIWLSSRAEGSLSRLDSSHIRQKKFIPINLNLEITDSCNLRCPMCLHSSAPLVHGKQYKRKIITVEEVKKIINEFINNNIKIKCISPFWFGESLTHPHFKEIVEFIFSVDKQYDLFNDFVLNTNAVLFTPEISDLFISYAQYITSQRIEKNIFLTFSIDFVTPKVFKKTKGGNEKLAAKIITNLEYFLKSRACAGMKTPASVFKFVVQGTNKHEAKAFVDFWSKKLDSFNVKYDIIDVPRFFTERDAICLKRLDGVELMTPQEATNLHYSALKGFGFYASDYADAPNNLQVPVVTFRRPCLQIFNGLLVTSHGVVSPCCLDARLMLSLGRLDASGLLNLIRGPKLHQMRLWHVRGELENLPFCASCFDPPGGCVSDEEVIKYLEETGEKEELARYKEKLEEEARVNSSAKKLPLEKAAPALQESDYQLRVYDFYPHKDNPASVIRARKVGELEFEPGLGVDLEVSYKFAESSQWVILEYTPKKKDWSGYGAVNIRLKGDGKGGRLQFIIQEQDGDNWYYFIEDAFDTTEWKEYSLALDKFTMPEWATKGDGQRTFDRIMSYKLLFERHESALKKEKVVSIGNIWFSTVEIKIPHEVLPLTSIPDSDTGLHIKAPCLNICILSREYPPDTAWGGIGTYTYNLAQGLVAAGQNVHVICQSMDVDRQYDDNGVHVHRVSHKSFFPLKGRLREFGLRWEYSQSVYNKLKEVIDKYKIDIIEAPNLGGEGFVYSFHKRTPLVTRLHTHFSEVMHFLGWQRDLDRRLSCWFENAAIVRSDLVTCSTKAHARVVAREVGIPVEKICIVPLGIPLPDLNGQTKTNNHPIILFVGRLEKRKGIHILVQAIPHVLKEIPNVRFVIIGRDSFIDDKSVGFEGAQGHSFKARLIRMIPEECKKNVEFLGYVSAQDLKRYYRECDLFVAPSLYESFGFIYIEAMSYAKPVIGCGVGGVPEVIKDGETGILVPPDDADRLSSAINLLLQNTPLAGRLGKNARDFVMEHFSIDSMVKHTLQVYREVM